MEGERRVNEWNDLNLGEEIEAEESRTRGSGMASMIVFPSTNAFGLYQYVFWATCVLE